MTNEKKTLEAARAGGREVALDNQSTVNLNLTFSFPSGFCVDDFLFTEDFQAYLHGFVSCLSEEFPFASCSASFEDDLGVPYIFIYDDNKK